MLNSLFDKGVQRLESFPVIFSEEKQVVIIKNGKSEGKTQAKNRFSPSKTDFGSVDERAK